MLIISIYFYSSPKVRGFIFTNQIFFKYQLQKLGKFNLFGQNASFEAVQLQSKRAVSVRAAVCNYPETARFHLRSNAIGAMPITL